MLGREWSARVMCSNPSRNNLLRNNILCIEYFNSLNTFKDKKFDIKKRNNCGLWHPSPWDPLVANSSHWQWALYLSMKIIICVWAWEICLHFVARVLDKKLAATEASSTRLRWKQLPKMQLFKNALQNEVIWKHRFPVLKSTDENGNFRKRWSHSNLSRAGWECFSATFPFLRHKVYLKMNISFTLNI